MGASKKVRGGGIHETVHHLFPGKSEGVCRPLLQKGHKLVTASKLCLLKDSNMELDLTSLLFLIRVCPQTLKKEIVHKYMWIKTEGIKTRVRLSNKNF